jgi:hypothetical protein
MTQVRNSMHLKTQFKATKYRVYARYLDKATKHPDTRRIRIQYKDKDIRQPTDTGDDANNDAMNTRCRSINANTNANTNANAKTLARFARSPSLPPVARSARRAVSVIVGAQWRAVRE